MKNTKPNSFLPYGENLRVLIAHSDLSISNHKNILNSKGIFLGNYDKNRTVPELMNILLDPSEFSELTEMQSEKEDKVKYRTLKLPWDSNVALLKAIPENFNLNKLVKDSFDYVPTYTVIGNPQFRKVKGEKGKIKLDFQIERENPTKGWDERISVHEGSLTLEKNSKGDLHLITTKTHTAKETNDLGEIVLKSLKDHFKKESYVKKEEDFERILFNHFTNKNRIKFLFGFTGNFNRSLIFKKLTDLSVSPDPKETPHEDLKDLLDGINQLRIKGKSLQSHVLISQQDYHEKIVFSSILIKYDFKMSEGNGNCSVEYVFSEYEDQQDVNSEFQFLVQSINVDQPFRQFANKNKIRENVNKILEAEKISLYEKYKN